MDFCGLQVAEYSILAVFVLIALCNQPLRPHRLQTALYPHLFLANVKTMPPTKGIDQFFCSLSNDTLPGPYILSVVCSFLEP